MMTQSLAQSQSIELEQRLELPFDLIGDIVYTFSLTPSQNPIEILPPEECGTGSDGQALRGFPMTEDATNITTVADVLLSYNTSFTLEEILSFYKSEMGNLGYILDSEVVVGTLATLRFTMGEEAVNLLVNSDGEGGFFVTIAKEE